MIANSSQPINKRIGLLVFPLRNPDEECGQGFISQLVALLAPLVQEIIVITGNLRASLPYDDVRIINVKAPIVRKVQESAFSKTLRFLLAQFTLSSQVIRQSKKVDIIALYLSAGLLLLPLFLARLLGKKVVIVTTGSGSQSLRAMYPNSSGRTYSAVVRLIEHLDYSLANKIVVYSPALVNDLGLEKYKNKISIAHKHFIDFDKFKLEKPLNERCNVVGYIGRLSEEKGILNFMEAILKVLDLKGNIRFLIGGAGQLRGKVEQHLCDQNLGDKAKFVGWIPHDELPEYLNDLKLVVLPSYTEGLPNIMLEAMACGTPVLATPVGAIPDIIKDGKTGFIMENNSPQCIAANIIRALNHRDLEQITQNARTLVQREFTYEKVVERYKEILYSL